MGFGSVSLSLFISNSVFATRQEEGTESGLPCPHGEIVHQKVTCSDEFLCCSCTKDVNKVDDRACTKCNTAMFFEFALFENLVWVIGGR